VTENSPVQACALSIIESVKQMLFTYL